MSTSPATLLPLPLAMSEPTIPDLKLASALGYERLTDIRKLIKRHQPLLEAMGSLRQHGVMIVVGKGAQRAVTEYHLTRPQAAFIIAKAGTKRANSLAVSIAEIFDMVVAGRLAPVDDAAAAELGAVQDRLEARLAAINDEERGARSDAFAMLGRGRSYGPGGRKTSKAKRCR
ncbi:hypothetical protein FG93_03508 [Bosea sp. LC85]|uniref:hypothetical protein n=1 Tax=Bosea sp. LC85 TaxID=1502851 RepID=UPI0004E44F66|nr:hypothetical protein [Bosea sp. LC85]KFC68886.1 hypothetical protein FG93_03508 [Bosea sp. LC85]